MRQNSHLDQYKAQIFVILVHLCLTQLPKLLPFVMLLCIGRALLALPPGEVYAL